MERQPDIRWARLLDLLGPFHGQAVATARRLSRSHADGDDLYQETVLRAFEKLHTLRDETRFRSWFYATLIRRHRTRLRRSFWTRLLPWEAAFPNGADPVGENGEAWAERAGDAARMSRALASLGAEQREAIVLFELDGFSIEEIAEMQQASVPAVKSRLSRGRQQLRQWYERRGFLGAKASGGAPRGESAPLGDRSNWAAVPATAQETSHD